MGINIVVLPDINHRTWNDAQLALKDSGQWLWCLVLLHLLNLDSGPWGDQRWWNTLKETAGQHVCLFCRSCPLVQHSLDELKEDADLREDFGMTSSTAVVEDDDGGLVNSSSLGDVVAKKIGKVGMCRWFQFVREVRRMCVDWTLRWVILSYIRISMGFKAIANALAVQARVMRAFQLSRSSSDVEKSGTSSDRKEVREIKSMCNNSLEFCQVVLSQRTIWKRMVAVSKIFKHAEEFHATHSVQNKSASESVKWWSNRAGDLSLDHISKILDEMRDDCLARQLGCHVQGCATYWHGINSTDPYVLCQNETCAMIGKTAVAIVRHHRLNHPTNYL